MHPMAQAIRQTALVQGTQPMAMAQAMKQIAPASRVSRTAEEEAGVGRNPVEVVTE
jgi:hypothetical protein